MKSTNWLFKRAIQKFSKKIFGTILMIVASAIAPNQTGSVYAIEEGLKAKPIQLGAAF